MNPEQREQFKLDWENSPASLRVQKNKVRTLFDLVKSKQPAPNLGPSFKHEGYTISVSQPLVNEGWGFTVRDEESRAELARINIFLGDEQVALMDGINASEGIPLSQLMSANPDDVDDFFQPQEGELARFNPALAILEMVLVEHIETERAKLLG